MTAIGAVVTLAGTAKSREPASTVGRSVVQPVVALSRVFMIQAPGKKGLPGSGIRNCNSAATDAGDIHLCTTGELWLQAVGETTTWLSVPRPGQQRRCALSDCAGRPDKARPRAAARRG